MMDPNRYAREAHLGRLLKQASHVISHEESQRLTNAILIEFNQEALRQRKIAEDEALVRRLQEENPVPFVAQHHTEVQRQAAVQRQIEKDERLARQLDFQLNR